MNKSSRRYCLTLDLNDDPRLIDEYKKYHEKGQPDINDTLRAYAFWMLKFICSAPGFSWFWK